ncbi:MAG: type I restriction endonuclease subunit R [Mycoplasma sp.]
MNNKVESERELENRFIKQLQKQEYELVNIKCEVELHKNFIKQINIINKEILNQKDLTDSESNRLLTSITGKNVYDSSKLLREKISLQRDNGKIINLSLFNSREWCKNIFQVTNQYTFEGQYKNIYDVTILINGLPLVSIELKRTGVELNEAFNQISRYKRHSLTGLFRFVQLFIISNGVNTKYFANNKNELKKEFTFFWTDEFNDRITSLSAFTEDFLNKCMLAKIIARYMILKSNGDILVMRPYQIYAVEKLIQRVQETNNNGYIWHTTGSGKTLTSFKFSQLLEKEPNVVKVFFMVDRKDLDKQTIDEFNKFQPDSIDQSNNTSNLISIINDPTKKIILTTIQKMDNACKNDRYSKDIKKLVDKCKEENGKVVFIIDECHRSQFGEMFKNIKKQFPDAQFIGFTGTPRIKEHPSPDGRTTSDIFEKKLHDYLIADAIRDNNVLPFSVDYIKTINQKWDDNDETPAWANIDKAEIMLSDDRITNIVNYILKNHDCKTSSRKFNSILTVSSIEALIKYYDTFYKLQKDLPEKSKLKIAAIYTYGANEDISEGKEHSRDSLERIIKNYNETYNENLSTNSYDEYFRSVSKNVKNNEVDILLVVNMFLTGFDAPRLNTLYVDKFLQYNNLIQAFSRTNRLFDKNKSHGNIVCFSTRKYDVDKAIKLFSDNKNGDVVLISSLDEYLEQFIKLVKQLKEHSPTPDSTLHNGDEEKIREFVLIFRQMLIILNKLKTFVEFEFDEKKLGISEQEFQNYKSKYLDISKNKTSNNKELMSVLNDIDFCIELLATDKINCKYIYELIESIIADPDVEDKYDKVVAVLKMIEDIANDFEKTKAELIKEFIASVDPLKLSSDLFDFNTELEEFKDSKKNREIEQFCKEYDLVKESILAMITEYYFCQYNDREEVKDLLSNETVKKYKEEKKIDLAMAAKNKMADEIINFIIHITTTFE